MVQKNMREETPKSSQGARTAPARRHRGIEVGRDDREQLDPRPVDLVILAKLGRKQRNDL